MLMICRNVQFDVPSPSGLFFTTINEITKRKKLWPPPQCSDFMLYKRTFLTKGVGLYIYWNYYHRQFQNPEVKGTTVLRAV
jgi:hypothetical protein